MTNIAACVRRSIEVLTPRECMRLLTTVPVGRVGITIDAMPAILPVHFAILDDAVIFRTVPATKLDAATAGAVIAFEADAYEAALPSAGWSVLIRGVARKVTDPGELVGARGLTLESWATNGRPDRFVRIEPTLVTGRRVS